jgi:hypothetical protein
MPVIALLAPHVEDTENQICLLSDIVELPKVRFSKMAGQKYFGNTCPKCGVLSGEFFLHSEPGAPFFPENEKEAKSLYLTEIPLSTAISVKASLSMGVGELILNNAKKV